MFGRVDTLQKPDETKQMLELCKIFMSKAEFVQLLFCSRHLRRLLLLHRIILSMINTRDKPGKQI